MRFKEIKSGMFIHCSTEEEVRALLAHLERIGCLWRSGDLPTECRGYNSWDCFCLDGNRITADDYRNVANDDNYELIEFTDLIMDPKPEKFNPGDLVRIRTDLMVDKSYGKIRFMKDRIPYKGTTCRVNAISQEGFYVLYGNERYWSEQMLEPADDSTNKKRPEMSAVEILQWLSDYEGTEAMYDLFGCYYLDSIWLHYPQEIVDKITTYEAQRKGEKT